MSGSVERQYCYVLADFETVCEARAFELAVRDCFRVIVSVAETGGVMRVWGYTAWPVDTRVQLAIFVRGWCAASWASLRRRARVT